MASHDQSKNFFSWTSRTQELYVTILQMRRNFCIIIAANRYHDLYKGLIIRRLDCTKLETRECGTDGWALEGGRFHLGSRFHFLCTQKVCLFCWFCLTVLSELSKVTWAHLVTSQTTTDQSFTFPFVTFGDLNSFSTALETCSVHYLHQIETVSFFEEWKTECHKCPRMDMEWWILYLT